MASSSSSSSVETKSSSSSVATRSSSSSISSSSQSSSSSSSSSSISSSSSSSSKEYSSWSSSSSSSSSASSSSSSSSSSAEVDTYASAAEIAAILTSFGITVDATDITDQMLHSTKVMLEKKTGTKWVKYYNHRLWIDGRNHNSIMCPIIPISNLHEVTVIGKDLEETTFTMTGDDRQIWWDGETGKIEIIAFDSYDIAKGPPFDYNYFPEGVKNVRLRGTFGKLADDTVKTAQAFMVLKQLSMVQPKTYALGYSMEKIGNYQYKLGFTGGKYVSLDMYIDNLLEDLKCADTMWMEEI